MLIDTTAGIINTAHIVKVTPTADFERSVVRLSNGESLTIDAGEMEGVCGLTIPAAPGFDVVSALLPEVDGDDILYIVEPVIAFRLYSGSSEQYPVPITVSGDPRCDAKVIWAVRQPNGVCFGPDICRDSLDDFKAACERAAQARQRSV